MSTLLQQGPAAVFAAFVVVHALADFPLQGDWLASRKSRSNASGAGEWIVALSAHGVIHGGGVWLVSGSLALGVAELVCHALIDSAKSAGRFGLVTDQLLHLGCKLAYTLWLFSALKSA